MRQSNDIFGLYAPKDSGFSINQISTVATLQLWIGLCFSSRLIWFANFIIIAAVSAALCLVFWSLLRLCLIFIARRHSKTFGLWLTLVVAISPALLAILVGVNFLLPAPTIRELFIILWGGIALDVVLVLGGLIFLPKYPETPEMRREDLTLRERAVVIALRMNDRNRAIKIIVNTEG